MAQRPPRQDTVKAWQPQPGPQWQALQCPAFEILYGGAAGGGKTDTLLAAALSHVSKPHYKAVIFRRTYPELEEVAERAKHLIPQVWPDAKESSSRHEWRFASGAKLLLRHLEDYNAALKHRSAEYSFVGFDELTTFEERQYRYLFTRCRSSKGLPLQILSATNPGGLGHEWVKERWAPWLATSHPHAALPGELRYVVTDPDTGKDRFVPKGTAGALSRTFIPARLTDNALLTRSDPGYKDRLAAQDPLTRKQLLEGDWDAAPAPKTFFRREWIPTLTERPHQARRVRYWDRAATVESTRNRDPDWTVGLLLSHAQGEGLYTVEDVVRVRLPPAGVRQLVLDTARADGTTIEQALSLDPGSAGVFEGDEYLRALTGYPVSLHRETGDKVVRAKALSAMVAPSPGALYGRLRALAGRWLAALLQELEEFPEGAHDDQVDALAGAYRVLSGVSLGHALDAALAASRARTEARPKRGRWSTW